MPKEEIEQAETKLKQLEKKAGKKPNIVIFLIDDVGWIIRMDPPEVMVPVDAVPSEQCLEGLTTVLGLVKSHIHDIDDVLIGRVDDVLNVSGHRLGTAELESALVLNENVAEAAVVGYPHNIKGQGIYAYVTLMAGVEESDELKKELVVFVRKEIGPIATIDILQWAPGLPKTRSGKIMRRILRKVAENEIDNLGDTSTLADPAVVDHLVENRANK